MFRLYVGPTVILELFKDHTLTKMPDSWNFDILMVQYVLIDIKFELRGLFRGLFGSGLCVFVIVRANNVGDVCCYIL